VSSKRNRHTFNRQRAIEAGRRSAEARRLARETPTPLSPADGGAGAPPNGEGHPPPRAEAHPRPASESEVPDYRRLATDKLQELLESSSAIAALGAAKELLNRTPKVEPEPLHVGPRGTDLREMVELARELGINTASAAVSAAEAVAQDLARERRERLPVDRPANGNPPELSKQEKREVVVDGVGGFFKEPEAAFVSEPDKALALSIERAEEEREQGRILGELGLDRPAFPEGDAP
jgi:hypothetical protein